MPYRADTKSATHVPVYAIWKACGITAARVRSAKARAKETGRMTEVWCGSVPIFAAYPDGRLKLSGRGEFRGAGRRRRRR